MENDQPPPSSTTTNPPQEQEKGQKEAIVATVGPTTPPSEEVRVVPPDSDKLPKNQRRMLSALKKSRGIVTFAAQLADIAERTHYRWLKKSPSYAAAVEQLHEERLDLAEARILESISEKDKESSQNARWLLEQKGNNRGYHRAGVAIQLNQQLNNGPIWDLKKIIKKAEGENAPAGH